jgi:hypothetical protein
LKLDTERLKLDTEKAKIERRQARWTAIAVIVPVLVAVLSLAVSLQAFKEAAVLQSQQSQDQFEMSAAQLVVNNTDPDVAYSKARVLHDLFPSRFKDTWTDTFKPTNYCLPVFDDRITFARLAIEHPTQRKNLASLWEQMYCNQSDTSFTVWLNQ